MLCRDHVPSDAQVPRHGSTVGLPPALSSQFETILSYNGSSGVDSVRGTLCGHSEEHSKTPVLAIPPDFPLSSSASKITIHKRREGNSVQPEVVIYLGWFKLLDFDTGQFIIVKFKYSTSRNKVSWLMVSLC